MSTKMLEILYPKWLSSKVDEITDLMQGHYGLSRRSIAVLLLQGDEDISALVHRQEGNNRWHLIDTAVKKIQDLSPRPLSYIVTISRQHTVHRLFKDVVQEGKHPQKTWLDSLGYLTMCPPVGIPILILVLYFVLYRFVGIFGAGTVVDYVEGVIFQTYLNPWVNALVEQVIPWPAIQDLLAHDYGIITLGLRYAVAIILPIVGCFFFAFSLIEDSGYLPRLALLIDFLFKWVGLSGRAVIPITLGFGCGTMATLVTRTLETERERVIATLLLALAIPCSAQLGVILSLLAKKPSALAIWGGFVLLVFIVTGYLMDRILPGEGPVFYMEVPPLRFPRLGNVLTKTFVRIKWYFFEILPMFVLSSILIWLGNITGFFNQAVSSLGRWATCIGLPAQTGAVFLFGFFRRDYGAAGLYDLVAEELLNTRQLVVAAVTLTLFVPCIAQFSVMVKERGWPTALAMAAFIFTFAFVAGFALNSVLTLLGLA